MSVATLTGRSEVGEMDLGELRAFGAAVEEPDAGVSIQPGGFIVPGRDPVLKSGPGKGRRDVTRQTAGTNERGREAGSRETGYREAGRSAKAGPSAVGADPSSNQTGSPAHTLGHRLNKALGLEELQHWYPTAAVRGTSSSLALLSAHVGVIQPLPYRGRLVLEIPLNGPFRVPSLLASTTNTYVPDVRVWATWEDGVCPAGYHVYPDASLCTHMQGEWIWGVNPLHELVDWSVLWLAKSLHLQILNRWPGPQHCSANVAMKRRMLDEYCRCGKHERYRACHYAQDRSRSRYELFREEQEGAAEYLSALRRSDRPAGPPRGA